MSNVHTVLCKVLGTFIFSPQKSVLSQLFIFCCSVHVGNISLHFQTFILRFIGII